MGSGGKTRTKRQHALGLPREAARGGAGQQLLDMTKGLVFVALAALVFWAVLRFATGGTPAPEGAVAMPARMPSAAEVLSKSSVEIVADKTTGAVAIAVAGIPSAGRLQADINFATKGDGAMRTVDVNGGKVDPVLVRLAAFENRDFVLPDEHPLTERRAAFDSRAAPQKSHFRAMTHPLVYAGGALAADNMRPGSTDVRASIADTGGRH
jgi:hypothetical protein